MPVAVSRGTVQIFTQSMLHSAWHNSTDEPRKGFIISWSAASVGIGFESGRTEALRESFEKLHTNMAAVVPGREHIVPIGEKFLHFGSDYDPPWPECFIPGKTVEDRGEGWRNGFAAPKL